jgi:hypothetical protein
MIQVKEHSSEIRSAHQPTMMEAELDSITYLLGQMRAKVQRNGVLEHLTTMERSELQAALARVEGRMTELGEVIRGAPQA